MSVPSDSTFKQIYGFVLDNVVDLSCNKFGCCFVKKAMQVSQEKGYLYLMDTIILESFTYLSMVIRSLAESCVMIVL